MGWEAGLWSGELQGSGEGQENPCLSGIRCQRPWPSPEQQTVWEVMQYERFLETM